MRNAEFGTGNGEGEMADGKCRMADAGWGMTYAATKRPTHVSRVPETQSERPLPPSDLPRTLARRCTAMNLQRAQWDQDQDQGKDEECKAARRIEPCIGLPSHSPRRNGRHTFPGCQKLCGAFRSTPSSSSLAGPGWDVIPLSHSKRQKTERNSTSGINRK